MRIASGSHPRSQHFSSIPLGTAPARRHYIPIAVVDDPKERTKYRRAPASRSNTPPPSLAIANHLTTASAVFRDPKYASRQNSWRRLADHDGQPQASKLFKQLERLGEGTYATVSYLIRMIDLHPAVWVFKGDDEVEYVSGIGKSLGEHHAVGGVGSPRRQQGALLDEKAAQRVHAGEV
ncbi:hypothetical protein BU16DRAFT_535494 [Lophium mytilinum]|uniref:Uncharacterized protein n=1 Tax=Lophium mytilinum TaxID=390894 RepID=A0A6A6R6G6_9PEZI|nr:hypothetical protein BU16DRAFT_535494 [Lophium mytilinum]